MSDAHIYIKQKKNSSLGLCCCKTGNIGLFTYLLMMDQRCTLGKLANSCMNIYLEASLQQRKRGVCHSNHSIVLLWKHRACPLHAPCKWYHRNRSPVATTGSFKSLCGSFWLHSIYPKHKPPILKTKWQKKHFVKPKKRALQLCGRTLPPTLQKESELK